MPVMMYWPGVNQFLARTSYPDAAINCQDLFKMHPSGLPYVAKDLKCPYSAPWLTRWLTRLHMPSSKAACHKECGSASGFQSVGQLRSVISNRCFRHAGLCCGSQDGRVKEDDGHSGWRAP